MKPSLLIAIGFGLLGGFACTREASDFAVLEANARTIQKGDSLDDVLKRMGDPDDRLEKPNPPGVALFYEGQGSSKISLMFLDGKFTDGAIESNGKFTRLPIPTRP
jgi:hypothetical protein